MSRALFALALVGCAGTPETAKVDVQAPGSLPPAVQLALELSISGRTVDRTLPDPAAGPIAFPTSFTATVPDGTDRLDVSVSALDASGAVVGYGQNGSPLAANAVTEFAVLIVPGAGPPDGGVPDLAAADLAAAPDLLPEPDLALPCGALGMRCCAGHPTGGHEADYCTDVGAVCAAALCVPCGGAGQPCCDANQCATGGCCDHSAGPRGACLAAGDACPNGAGSCAAGVCANGGVTCGDEANGPCAGGTGCTAPSTVITTTANGDACAPCGGEGQDCCFGANGGWCVSAVACDQTGKCAICGAPGDPCCRGSACVAPNQCMAATGSCG